MSTYASSATGQCGHRNRKVRYSQLECAGSATRACGLRNSNVRAPQLESAAFATRMCGLRNWNVRAPRLKCASSWAGMFSTCIQADGCICIAVYVYESICTYASCATWTCACILVHAYIGTCECVELCISTCLHMRDLQLESAGSETRMFHKSHRVIVLSKLMAPL